MSGRNLDVDELAAIGFAELGHDVRIDRSVAVFNPAAIHIGSHVRIDAFTVLAGGARPLRIGSFNHISAACYLSAGEGGITLADFCALAPRVAVHGRSDDYVGGALTGGIVPSDLTAGPAAHIELHAHVIVGSGSVLLPGAVLRRGCAVGALTLVKGEVPEGVVVAGAPARQVGTRATDRLDAQAVESWRRMP